MQRSLFQGEVTLHTWSDLTLTSHRVWRLKKEGDTQAIQSMLIDAVQAVSLERRSHPLLLLFALFCAAGSYAADAAVVGVGSALVLVLIFFLLRTVVVTIHGGGVTISKSLDGFRANISAALQFLDAVEARALTVRHHTPKLVVPTQSSTAPPPTHHRTEAL
jgi:hypothetical protein